MKIDKVLLREMKREIKSVEEQEDDIIFRPNFEGVLKRDAEELMYEAHEKDFRGIELFTRKDKDFLIEFSLAMKVEEFTEGQLVYEKDDSANYFFVIKQGAVEFCLPEEHSISFMECHGGYFGEWELLKSKKRLYTVKCLKDTTVYKISKPIFFDLFVSRERKFKTAFVETATKRSVEMEKAFQLVRRLAATLLDEIRQEFNQKNPFYNFQKAVRSEKFRVMFLDGKKRVSRRQKKKQNQEFLRKQKERTETRKKTIFLQANFDQTKMRMSNRNINASIKSRNNSRKSGKASRKSSAKYEISQKMDAQLRRRQSVQKNKLRIRNFQRKSKQ